MQQLRFFSPLVQVLGSCWLMPATTNSTTTATSEFYLILYTKLILKSNRGYLRKRNTVLVKGTELSDLCTEV